jgi:hypothetical protein
MGIGAGISFSASGVLQALSNLSTTVVGEVVNTIASLVGPWRPPQWAAPPPTSITVPATTSSSASSLGQGVSGTGSSGFTFSTGVAEQVTTTPAIVYVFDGVLKLEHTQEIELTQHPVQSGSNIADHAFIKPARLTMDVFMSDAMQAFIIGQWSGSASKSVNCYQTILQLELSRTPLTITTRLNTYTNMVIVSIHTPDDYKTKFGLRATITFQQVPMATTATSSASSRPQDTGTTGVGIVPTTTVPEVVTNNYLQTTPLVSAPVVSGAGDYSSNPVDDDPPGFS